MTNKEYMTIIGQHIKKIMKEQGLTAKALSEKIEKSPQYVSNVLNGNQGATFEVLELFSKALGVEIWQLFKEGEENAPSIQSITCPKCGEVIPVEVNVKDTNTTRG